MPVPPALATGIMSMGEKKGLSFANSYNIPVIMFVQTEDGFRTILSNKAKKIIDEQNKAIEN